MSEKYTEILRLKTMLEEAKIPFIFHNFHDGYQIVITRGNTKLCDAIEHRFSYGSEENLQEEVCDCIIMIDQLRLMFKLDAYDIDEIINMKIKRTLKRLGIK